MSECNGNLVSTIVNAVTATKDWDIGFQWRCTERLEKLGDTAMYSRSYNKAAEHFSTVLSLNPVDPMDILIKRSKARSR